VELPDALVDPATWVNIRLRMPKPTGDFLEITLLRPVEWLAEHLAQATALDGEYPQALVESRGTDSTSGSTTVSSVMPTVDPPELSPGMVEPITGDSSTASPWIFLTLHELEAVGPAEIVEVGACPDLESGEGRLVTGTFAHQSGEVFDITVDGLTEPIGCTGAHPFWSEDRHAFIPARDLRPGETLRTESGTLRQITRITPRRGPPVPVFNLEVDAEHVYYVSVDGVLVHNTYTNNAPRGAAQVYQHLDELGNENYIGISGDLGRRAREHLLDPSATGQTMRPLTDPLTHDQARTIEAMRIRQRLSEARAKGLIDGTESVEEQLRKAGLLNKNRGRDPSRWLDLDPDDFIKEFDETFNIRTPDGR